MSGVRTACPPFDPSGEGLRASGGILTKRRIQKPRAVVTGRWSDKKEVHISEKPEKVLVIGSGPIIIGQMAKFDYAGTQACKALREEGVTTVLVNSNPATIMTDQGIAESFRVPLDNVYVFDWLLGLMRSSDV